MKQYIADAFTDKIFSGNPAAVCVLDKWLDDELMLKIARENNLSETAFAVKESDKYHLRWFTPAAEVDLCGHATLATAFIILSFYEKSADKVSFTTLSGDLVVSKNGDLLEMDFPVYTLEPVPVTEQMADAIGVRPLEAFMGRDLLCVLPSADDVINFTPDLNKVKLLDGLILHTTAAGSETDCVSRSFAPKLNVPEDPVCGSGHCHIVPYWADRLGKNEIVAYQASLRGGTLFCTVRGDRITLAGKAALFAEAEIFVD